MATDLVPSRDAAFLTWSKLFASVASANAAALHLTEEETSALSDAAAGFAAALSASEAAKASLKGLVSEKVNRRNEAEAIIRTHAKMISADPTISVDLKGALGLNLGERRSAPVTEPSTVCASGQSNGTNLVTWNRNGNSRSTIFILEAKIGNGQYTVIDVLTRTRFEHKGQIPGQQICYRVRAKRGDVISGPSNVAVVYLGSGVNSVVQVAA